MTRNRLLALLSLSLMATSVVTVSAESFTVTKPTGLVQVQAGITQAQNLYAKQAQVLEAAANVPVPDYIRNGTPAPGLVTTTDHQTNATASIIMNTPAQAVSAPAVATSLPANQATGSNPAPTATPVASYQGQQVLAQEGNTIIVDGSNTSNSPARYQTAADAALPTATLVKIPQSNRPATTVATQTAAATSYVAPKAVNPAAVTVPVATTIVNPNAPVQSPAPAANTNNDQNYNQALAAIIKGQA